MYGGEDYGYFASRRPRRATAAPPSMMHGEADADAAERQERCDRTALAAAFRDAARLRGYVACLATGNHHLLSATTAMQVYDVFGETGRGTELRPWSEEEALELGGMIQCWRSLGADQVDSGGSEVIMAPAHAPVSGERFLVRLRAREDMEFADVRRAAPPPVTPRPATDEEWEAVLRRAAPRRSGAKEAFVLYALQERYGRPEAARTRLPAPDIARGAAEQEVCRWAQDLRYWVSRAIRSVETDMPQLLAPEEARAPRRSPSDTEAIPPEPAGYAPADHATPSGKETARRRGKYETQERVTIDLTSAEGVMRMLGAEIPRGADVSVVTPF